MHDSFKAFLMNKANLAEEQVDELISILKTKTFAKGQHLLNKGEVCRHAFFVEHGLLRSYTIDPAGKEHIIQFAPENWFVTDRGSAYFGEPSDLFIDAIEETTTVLVDADFVNKASEVSSSFRQYNERALHNHIRHLQQRINLLLSASAEKRYIEFVRLYPDLTLRVPQWMIASFLGITPESLSRVRKELAKKNFSGK